MCKGNMSWSNKFFKYIYPLNKSCILRLSKVDHLILRNHFFSLLISQLDCSPLLLIGVWLIVNQEGCLQCIGAWVVNLQILLQDQGRTYAGGMQRQSHNERHVPCPQRSYTYGMTGKCAWVYNEGFFTQFRRKITRSQSQEKWKNT